MPSFQTGLRNDSPAVPGRPGLHGRRNASVSPTWLLAALVAGTGSLSANTISTWTLMTGGDWNTPANWTDGVVPNAVAATATLDNSLASQTINLSAPVTIGRLNAASNFVSGDWRDPLTFTGQAITFNNNGNGASLDMSPTGNNRRLVFNNSFVLNDNLAITHGTQSIALNGGASGAGNILSSGTGVQLAGNFSNWSGDLSGNVTIGSTGIFGDGNGTLREATTLWRSTTATLTLNHAINVSTFFFATTTLALSTPS